MLNNRYTLFVSLVVTLQLPLSTLEPIQLLPSGPHAIADFSEEFDVGEVKICAEGNKQCLKVTCLDLCVAAGEDAAECPLYCNTYTLHQTSTCSARKT